jgi:hypothetical protein
MSEPEPVVRLIDVPLVRTLEPARTGDVMVSFTISPEGEAVIAWASAEDAGRLRGRDERGGASFPRPILDRPATLRVTIDGADYRMLRELTEVTCSFPTVHGLPGDRILVVGARAARRGGKPDQNAIVFGADDRRSHSACVGDGVQGVCVTASGAIWVGYFDEGVLGNFGWEGERVGRIGAAGLTRFDPELVLRWSYPFPGEILDCYAMTTTGEDCYACPYTEWPILRIARNDHVERWSNDIQGAHAMLVSGTQVALIGGYRDERDRVVVGSLERGQLRRAAMGRLRMGERPWSDVDAVLGRDGMLHALAGDCWHSIELWDLLAALA